MVTGVCPRRTVLQVESRNNVLKEKTLKRIKKECNEEFLSWKSRDELGILRSDEVV